MIFTPPRHPNPGRAREPAAVDESTHAVPDARDPHDLWPSSGSARVKAAKRTERSAQPARRRAVRPSDTCTRSSPCRTHEPGAEAFETGLRRRADSSAGTVSCEPPWLRHRAILALLTLAWAAAFPAATASAHATELEQAPSLREYFAIGVEHILGGFDHLVFLLGVVLIATGLRAVILAVTTFTAAHSITLALSISGLVAVSPRVVEPLIALSVAYVGFENFVVRAGAARYRISFIFGLIHGFGFAGALSEIGLPRDQAPAALALFNAGVEAGQLMALAVLLPLLHLLRRHARAFRVTARIANAALILLGGAWALERTLGGDHAEATTHAREPTQSAALEPTSRGAENEPGALRPLYPAAAISPLAAALCEATQRLPRLRRAACDNTESGPSLEAACTGMLSAALASGALTLDQAKARECIAAMQARYASCDFTRAAYLSQLPECTNLYAGNLAHGGACRSNLECRPGLHCQNLGAFEPGQCANPKPDGTSCNRSTDPLAAYLPRTDAHPECQGTCVQNRCSTSRGAGTPLGLTSPGSGRSSAR